MRGINERFINDLLNGELSYFLNQVKDNPDLCLEVRQGYINIYYRGGSLLKITQKRSGYQFSFDSKYCLNKSDNTYFELFNNLSAYDITNVINYFPTMISEMDSWFAVHPKLEREFQHNLLKSNTCIIDIEYQIRRRSRLDMLVYSSNKVIIVENKFGGGAISGKSGIAKHYKDISDILLEKDLTDELIDSIINISKNKCKLGLRDIEVKKEDIKDIEIIFLFAGYNKKSKAIVNEIKFMNKLLPAKVLFMDKNNYIIDYNDAIDLFCYEY